MTAITSCLPVHILLLQLSVNVSARLVGLSAAFFHPLSVCGSVFVPVWVPVSVCPVRAAAAHESVWFHKLMLHSGASLDSYAFEGFNEKFLLKSNS